MERDRRLQLLTDALRGSSDGSVLERVCAGALTGLGMTGVTMAVMSERDGGGSVATAGVHGSEVFDLHFELGEGPCHDAFNTDTEVLVSDLAATGPGRWPVFTAAVLERGVTASFTFPARLGAIRIGVLHVQRDRPGAMTADQLIDARIFAEICAVLVIDRDAALDDDHLIASGWPHRAVVHQATGMVATHLGVTLVIALARLRAYAFGESVALEDVARDVVQHRLRLDP